HRVLMTSSSFSSGLFEVDQSPVQAPVFTSPYDDDDLLAVNFRCLNGWSDVFYKYRTFDDTVDMPSQILNAMRFSDFESEWKCKSPPPEQSDTIISEFQNPITNASLTPEQRECAETDARTFMFNYIEMLSGSGANATTWTRLRRTIGNLVNLTEFAVVPFFKNVLFL
ncbi:hypothetical protein PMAYCL1PPCAC_21936, partial [Pristionchus mayeri]